MAMNERAIFEAALQIADATARAAFLENACGDEAGLRASVETLLQSRDTAESDSHCKDAEPKRTCFVNEPTGKPSRNQIPGAMLLGILMMMPIVFGHHLSAVFNTWFWPETPSISSSVASGGLDFDGKNDCVKVSPVHWTSAQFTIEAFVTASPKSHFGVMVDLQSEGGKRRAERRHRPRS